MTTITLPFSQEALQDALQRHLSSPSLSVGDVVPSRMGGGASGSPVYRLDVQYDSGHSAFVGDSKLSVVLKRGTQRAGAHLAGAARREASFYSTLASQLPVHTPRLLMTADDITGEPTMPLVVGASSGIAKGWEQRTGDRDWVLMEALPQEGMWPRAFWTAEHYRAALSALAEMHAKWWEHPPSTKDYPWVWMPTGAHTQALLEDARAAMLEIESAPWREKFFSVDELRAWRDVLDDPACLLDILSGIPQTLIHGDYWPGNIAMKPDGPAVFDWQQVGVGPAAYDLACFHSSSRWWFGRLPISLVEMRNHYLACLNEHLGYRVDRYIFDMGMDAARAWRFAVLWPTTIVEQRPHLLARLNYMRTTVIEPAYTSLRRIG
ncbi:MAG: aminoglycoside phosphotransferase family protein [Chloroflexota bacterium]